jgi:hypothetical protein
VDDRPLRAFASRNSLIFRPARLGTAHAPIQLPSPAEARVKRTLTELQEEIMCYISNNKSAAETPRGVNCVWLRRGNSNANVAQAHRALEELASRGLVERFHLPGRVTVYRPAGGSKKRKDEERAAPARAPEREMAVAAHARVKIPKRGRR